MSSLEEVLTSNHNQLTPIDASRAILSYLTHELSILGSPDAEYRFCRTIYPLIVSRVFGPIQQSFRDAFVHESSGWLFREDSWCSTKEIGGGNNNGVRRSGGGNGVVTGSASFVGSPGGMIRGHATGSGSGNFTNDPVVVLLSVSSGGGIRGRGEDMRSSYKHQSSGRDQQAQQQQQLTLMDVLNSGEVNQSSIQFFFPFYALPGRGQRLLFQCYDAAMSNNNDNGTMLQGSDNCRVLYTNLLRVSPLEQRHVFTFYRGCRVGTTPKNACDVMMMLTLLEYYFFVFVRFPLAKQQQPSNKSSNTNSSSGQKRQSQRRRNREGYGDKVYSHLFRNYVSHYLSHDQRQGWKKLHRPAELLLRVVIEFWMEGENEAFTNMQFMQWKEQQQQQQLLLTDNNSNNTNNTAEDAIHATQMSNKEYKMLPPLASRGLRYLTTHLLSDPNLERNVSVGGMDVNDNGGERSWCLSVPMTIMQQPLLNYVRLAFKFGPLHLDSDSPFYTALDVWLSWLEPWNFAKRKTTIPGTNYTPTIPPKVDHLLHQIDAFTSTTYATSVAASSSSYTSSSSTTSTTTPTTATQPKPTSRSKYTRAWEPYIIANFHLYTIPLMVFLRRAREFDFSPRDFNKSLTLLQRVFRVFTPEIMSVLRSVADNDMSSSSSLSMLVHHEENLAPYGPHNRADLFQATAVDIITLLEEVYFQHYKKTAEMDFWQRMDDKLEAVTGSGSRGELAALEAIVVKARSIANLGDWSYAAPASNHASVTAKQPQQRPSRTTPTTTSINKNKTKPERMDNNLLLTSKGRNQLLRGTHHFSPMDVQYLGDPMLSRVKSYEIPILVELSIRASCYLNVRFGFVTNKEKEEDIQDDDATDKKQQTTSNEVLLKLVKEGDQSRNSGFRINLRFLADYRNLVFLGLVLVFIRVWVRVLW